MLKPFQLLTATVTTGIVTGIFAIIFLWLIDAVISIAYGSGDFAINIQTMPDWQRVLIPTLGGFMVGLIVIALRRTDISGEGVPEVLEAVNKNRSRLKLLAVPLKILTTAITLGTGGSAGKEGPIVQIGATLGSAIGSLAKYGERDRRLLLAAGAAAGIAGVFNAPIAGVIFSLELVIKRVTIFQTILIIISAYTANVVVHWYDIETISIPLSATPVMDWSVLALSAPLGIIAGGLAILFGFSLFLSTVLFSHYKVSAIIPSTIGGFIVGLIGLAIPFIHEPMAHPLIVDILSFASIPGAIIAGIIVAKIVATGVTLGSGGSGGVFAPALLIGTLLGALFAVALGMFGLSEPGFVTTIILIGMAAFFAGVTHAPFTAVMIIVELTKEPMVVPAITIAAFTGYLTAKLIHKESVYTEHLDRNGGYYEKFDLKKPD